MSLSQHGYWGLPVSLTTCAVSLHTSVCTEEREHRASPGEETGGDIRPSESYLSGSGYW